MVECLIKICFVLSLRISLFSIWKFLLFRWGENHANPNAGKWINTRFPEQRVKCDSINRTNDILRANSFCFGLPNGMNIWHLAASSAGSWPIFNNYGFFSSSKVDFIENQFTFAPWAYRNTFYNWKPLWRADNGFWWLDKSHLRQTKCFRLQKSQLLLSFITRRIQWKKSSAFH